MEETLKNIFSVFISIVILFLFPLFITFEKRDDIAYSMATKITYKFVENVRNKGYITLKMYSDFESNLAATGDLYEIKMEHRANKVYPYKYTEADGSTVNTYKFVEELYTEKQIIPIISKDVSGIEPLKVFYDMDSGVYKSDNILDDLNYGLIYMYSITDVVQYEDERKIPIYPMNIGDTFNITVKNTNTSIAARIFQIFTGNYDDNNNVRIYVNYGGTILNEEYES